MCIRHHTFQSGHVRRSATGVHSILRSLVCLSDRPLSLMLLKPSVGPSWFLSTRLPRRLSTLVAKESRPMTWPHTSSLTVLCKSSNRTGLVVSSNVCPVQLACALMKSCTSCVRHLEAWLGSPCTSPINFRSGIGAWQGERKRSSKTLGLLLRYVVHMSSPPVLSSDFGCKAWCFCFEVLEDPGIPMLAEERRAFNHPGSRVDET